MCGWLQKFIWNFIRWCWGGCWPSRSCRVWLWIIQIGNRGVGCHVVKIGKSEQVEVILDGCRQHVGACFHILKQLEVLFFVTAEVFLLFEKTYIHCHYMKKGVIPSYLLSLVGQLNFENENVFFARICFFFFNTNLPVKSQFVFVLCLKLKCQS